MRARKIGRVCAHCSISRMSPCHRSGGRFQRVGVAAESTPHLVTRRERKRKIDFLRFNASFICSPCSPFHESHVQVCNVVIADCVLNEMLVSKNPPGKECTTPLHIRIVFSSTVFFSVSRHFSNQMSKNKHAGLGALPKYWSGNVHRKSSDSWRINYFGNVSCR